MRQCAQVKRWRLIVRNLAFAVTPESLCQLLAPAGFVWEAHLPRNERGQSRGFGFVAFVRREEAERALALFNGTQLCGRPVALDWALAKDRYSQVAPFACYPLPLPGRHAPGARSHRPRGVRSCCAVCWRACAALAGCRASECAAPPVREAEPACRRCTRPGRRASRPSSQPDVQLPKKGRWGERGCGSLLAHASTSLSPCCLALRKRCLNRTRSRALSPVLALSAGRARFAGASCRSSGCRTPQGEAACSSRSAACTGGAQ